MIIDMHTHIFPDNIANKTISHLSAVGGVSASTDGTEKGLFNSMEESGVSCSVILPVVTNPAQHESVNEFACQITEKYSGQQDHRLISFGGIHPDCADYKALLLDIKNKGLKGIKLHPDYQKTFIDDTRYLNIIDYAIQLDLFVSIHAGIDIGLPDVVHCTPKRASLVLSKISSSKIIFAHMGGYDMWNDVEYYLVGSSCSFDLGYTLGSISDNQLKRMIKSHGSEKIYFATDSPWSGQKEDLVYLKSLNLEQNELNNILYKNAISFGILS